MQWWEIHEEMVASIQSQFALRIDLQVIIKNFIYKLI